MNGRLPLSHSIRGMLAAAVAYLCYSIGDVLLKGASETYPPITLAYFVAIFSVIVLVAYAAASRQMGDMFTSTALKLHVARGCLIAASYLCFLYALARLPLANTYTFGFAMPFVLTILTFVMLREKPTLKAIIVLGIGFSGVMIALRPGDWQLNDATLAGLGIGVFWAISNLLIRYMPRDEHWLTIAMFPLLVEAAIYCVLGFIFPGTLIGMPTHDLMLMVAVGIAMAVGMGLITWAYRVGKTYIIASFHYTQLVWGVLFGWLLFGDVLDVWTAVGAGMIIASGLWLLSPYGPDEIAQDTPLSIAANPDRKD